MSKRVLLSAAISAALTTVSWNVSAEQTKGVSLEQIGRFETGAFGESAAEIVAYDASSSRLFVINANDKTVDILNISDPSAPVLPVRLQEVFGLAATPRIGGGTEQIQRNLIGELALGLPRDPSVSTSRPKGNT